MQGISDTNVLKKFSEDFCRIVEKHGKYIIVSGFLAIATGRSRATQNIDMILERISKQKFSDLHSDLVKQGFSCIQSDDPCELYEYYLKENGSIRYIFNKQMLPEMEVKFAKDALDDSQIKTRIKIPLTGVDVWFSTVEMSIAFKEEYLKSEKDMEDAKHLRIVFQEQINERRINDIKQLIKQVKLK